MPFAKIHNWSDGYLARPLDMATWIAFQNTARHYLRATYPIGPNPVPIWEQTFILVLFDTDPVPTGSFPTHRPMPVPMGYAHFHWDGHEIGLFSVTVVPRNKSQSLVRFGEVLGPSLRQGTLKINALLTEKGGMPWWVPEESEEGEEGPVDNSSYILLGIRPPWLQINADFPVWWNAILGGP